MRGLSILCVLFFICVSLGFSQKTTYLDSLSTAISGLPKPEQIKLINAIQYDKAVSNIHVYEDLTNRAICYSENLGDELLLADSYLSKSLALFFTARNDEAIKLTFDAIEIYKRKAQHGRIGDAYVNLAWNIKQQDMQKAFFYMNKGIKLLEKRQAFDNISKAYDNFGVLHGSKKNWDSAFFYHRKSLAIKKQEQDSLGIPFGYSHLANIYIKQEKFGLAKQYLDSAFTIREKRHDIYGIADSHLYYGDFYFAKNEWEKAIFHFEKGYDLAAQNNYHPLEKYASEYLFKSYASLPDHQKALKYNIIFNALKDSVLNLETNGKIAELEIRYQTAEKEAALARNRASLVEKELQVKRKNFIIFGTLLLALLLIIIGYLLYRQQKAKHRKVLQENELKMALGKVKTQNRLQAQRLRISRDLHDNIGSQLTFVISSLDNLKFGFKGNDPTVKGKIEEIGLFTANTINQLRDTIWAMNKDKISLEDLIARISNLISTAQKASKIDFKLLVKPNVDLSQGFSSEKGMNIYRIVQEAINNAVKHARANSVKVVFSQEKNRLAIEIADDGIGMEKTHPENNGLKNMRHRAKKLKAKMHIEGNRGNGTLVSLIIPLKRRNQKPKNTAIAV